MSNQILNSVITILAVPLLVATAWAQSTPSAPQPNSQTTPEQKARQDELDRLNHQKSVADTEKAIAEAQKATRAAQSTSIFGSLENYKGADGTTTAQKADGHGQLEATLLASLAMREAVEPLGERLGVILRQLAAEDRELGYACLPTRGRAGADDCPAAALPIAAPLDDQGWQQLCHNSSSIGAVSIVRPRPIVIVTADAKGPIALAEMFESRSAGMARELCRALFEADERDRTSPAIPRNISANAEGRGGSALAVAGTAVNTLANILRTNYTIYGIALTVDQDLLVRELARDLLSRGVANPIYTPGLFPLGQTGFDNPVIRRIALLDRLRAEAWNAAQTQVNRSRALDRWLPTAGDRTAEVRAAKELHDRAKGRLEAAIKAYDDLMTQLSASTGSDFPTLSSIIRQGPTAERLSQGALLVVTNVHFMGGTAYSRQNFFSSLFGMPYRVSGGVLISYVVEEGQSGRVRDARSVPVSGGFHRPTEIERTVREANRAQAQAEASRRGSH